MRKYFLTLDLEEWYHLEYAKEHKEAIASKQRFANQVLPFLQSMVEENVYLTVFVLEDVALENPKLIKEIHDMGHEIACHGSSHELVYELTKEEFINKTKRAKQTLDEIIGEPIKGYRAPCFSMETEKLEKLWELGFTYDSSLIRFKEHELYNVMDLKEYTKVESMIYRKDNVFEFETPTLDIVGKSIPISGGGYFRLFPLWLMKLFMRKHWEQEDNFVFYIHPFEVVKDKLENGSVMGRKNYFRFQVGRNSSEKKLKKYVQWLKTENVQFMRFKDYLKEENDTICKEGVS